jgi:hypothetical protein
MEYFLLRFFYIGIIKLQDKKKNIKRVDSNRVNTEKMRKLKELTRIMKMKRLL